MNFLPNDIRYHYHYGEADNHYISNITNLQKLFIVTYLLKNKNNRKVFIDFKTWVK